MFDRILCNFMPDSSNGSVPGDVRHGEGGRGGVQGQHVRVEDAVDSQQIADELSVRREAFSNKNKHLISSVFLLHTQPGKTGLTFSRLAGAHLISQIWNAVKKNANLSENFFFSTFTVNFS